MEYAEGVGVLLIGVSGLAQDAIASGILTPTVQQEQQSPFRGLSVPPAGVISPGRPVEQLVERAITQISSSPVIPAPPAASFQRNEHAVLRLEDIYSEHPLAAVMSAQLKVGVNW